MRKNILPNNLSIHVCVGEYMHIPHDLLRALDNPSQLEFIWSPEKKTLYICACLGSGEELDVIPVPGFPRRFIRSGYKLRERYWLQEMKCALEKGSGSIVRIPGSFFHTGNGAPVAAFDLNKAVTEKESLGEWDNG